MTYFRKQLLTLTFVLVFPLTVAAEELTIFQGSISNAVAVAPGNTTIIESATSIVEASLANPGVADFNMQSGTALVVTGINEGRTTLSVIDRQGNVNNIEILVATNARDVARVDAPDTPRPRTASVSLVGTSNVSVYGSGAIAIETDQPFESIVIADTSIADGIAITDSSVYLLGKRYGTTTLTLSRADGSDDTVIAVDVVEYPGG